MQQTNTSPRLVKHSPFVLSANISNTFKTPEQPQYGLVINVFSILLLVASVFLLNNLDVWLPLVQPTTKPQLLRQNYDKAGDILDTYEAEMAIATGIPLTTDDILDANKEDISIATSIPIATDLPIETDILIETDVPVST
jgi:hypothetical protein